MVCRAMILLDNVGEKSMAQLLYSSVKRKRPTLAALKYYEFGEGLRQGDVAQAVRINKSMPADERITAKSVLIAKARKLLGG